MDRETLMEIAAQYPWASWAVWMTHSPTVTDSLLEVVGQYYVE